MPKGYRKDGTPIKPPNAGLGPKIGNQPKRTKEVKTMIYEALQGLGGPAWLIKQAKEYPAAFFGLVGRLVPLQNDVNLGGKIGVISREPITAEQWAERVQADLGSTEGATELPDRLSS